MKDSFTVLIFSVNIVLIVENFKLPSNEDFYFFILNILFSNGEE